MKIFISWSGSLSKQMALNLRKWLPQVIQSLKPFVSDEDIRKGKRWSSEIAEELDKGAFGIICVVPENLTEPWINFEAGALSRNIETGYVAPLLFGLSSVQLSSHPLGQFQCTEFNQTDMEKLLASINESNPSGQLDPSILNTSFIRCWPELELKFQSLKNEADKQSDSTTTSTRQMPDDKKHLEDMEIKILLLLHKNEHSPTDYLADQLGISKTKCTHYLDSLKEINLVYAQFFIEGPVIWDLDKEGRAYLVKNALID